MKRFKDFELLGNDRVGLFVGREQIKTWGHFALEQQMVGSHSRNIWGMGSVEKSGIPGNPLTPEQRALAHRGIWGDAFDIVPLEDIGATEDIGEWAAYVRASIAAQDLPEPTDFYAGSIEEAR